MMRYYLLSCTLPGNIEKEVIAVKRSLFKKSGIPSAMVLPPIVPLQWFLELPSPEDVTLGPKLPEHGDLPGGVNKKRGEDHRFATLSPRMEKGLWWLPVLPPPEIMHKGEILRPYPGVPLVTAPSKSSTPDLPPSTHLLSGEGSALQQPLQTIPSLTWKAMGLSCFVFSFSVFHFPGETITDEGTANEGISENEEAPETIWEPWNTSIFWERGVEWEEVWRFKKPVLPGE